MALTYFLAQVIGYYFIAVALVLLFRKDMFIGAVQEVYKSRSFTLVGGLTALLLGLLMVLSHNYWNAGHLALVVTVIGWLALIKGLVLLFAPQALSRAVHMWRIAQLSYLYVIIFLIIGIYLVHGGTTHLGILG